MKTTPIATRLNASQANPIAKRVEQLKDRKAKTNRRKASVGSAAAPPQLFVPVASLNPHPILGMVGMVSSLYERDETKGKKDGSKREDRKERAEEFKTEFAAMVASILKHGVLDPIKVVKDAKGKWLIADGRNRWSACQEISKQSYVDAKHETFARAWP